MREKAFRLVLAVALFASALVTSVSAQTLPDRRTLLTFSGPVAMPGVTLPAGTYVFRVANHNTSADVVQVLSEDGRQPYGFFFSIPVERSEATAAPEVRLMEAPAGTPPGIRSWWYTDERAGYEFIYPREQARQLAKTASQPVLTTRAETSKTEDTNTSELARISSSGEDIAANKPNERIPSGTSQQGRVASSSLTIQEPTLPSTNATRTSPSGNVATSGTIERTRTALPRTATSTPTVALLGTIVLIAGICLMILRRAGL